MPFLVAAVEIGRILGHQRFHLLYLIVIPRLLSLGLAPAEVLAKFEVVPFAHFNVFLVLEFHFGQPFPIFLFL